MPSQLGAKTNNEHCARTVQAEQQTQCNKYPSGRRTASKKTSIARAEAVTGNYERSRSSSLLVLHFLIIVHRSGPGGLGVPQSITAAPTRTPAATPPTFSIPGTAVDSAAAPIPCFVRIECRKPATLWKKSCTSEGSNVNPGA